MTGEPFSLVGTVTHWDPLARLLRIFDLDVVLEPHVLSDWVSPGVVVLVEGRHDEKTGLRLVGQLRPWAM